MSELYDTEQPIVETTHGKVRGQLRTTVYEDKFYCFDGIPYAKPPLAGLRFKAPQPAEPWIGIKDCTQLAPKCLQFSRYTQQVEGSEDCLYLNVSAKKLKSDKPLPVMVYVHGGAFTSGNPARIAWGPDYFMSQDVIFISIGYRFGALGFLSLPERDLQVPGNAGLQDIALALRWINKNCHNFNGDSANITLFGHSSGSSLVQLLMLSPNCKGLFHKVILMAGSTMNLLQKPHVVDRFVKHAGYMGDTNDHAAILEYLRTVEAEKLVRFDFWTPEEIDRTWNLVTFSPCVEPYTTSESMITKEPVELLADKTAWCHDMPVILGGTSFEGLVRYKFFKEEPARYERYKENPEYLLPLKMQLGCDMETQKRLAKKLLKLHFGEKELCVENGECTLDLISYDMVYYPNHCFLNTRLPLARASTYLYRFDLDSPIFNLYRIKLCGPNLHGAGHVDELSYIFYLPESFKLPADSIEYQTIQRMIGMWTAFAACSDPNIPLIEPVKWLPLAENGTRKCLNISHDISCIDWPEAPKCETWDRLHAEAGFLQLN